MPSSCNNWQSAGTPLNSSICSLRVSTWLRGLVRSENVFDPITTRSWISEIAFVWSRALGSVLPDNKAKCWEVINVVFCGVILTEILFAGYIMFFCTIVAKYIAWEINRIKALLASTVYVVGDGEICIQTIATQFSWKVQYF